MTEENARQGRRNQSAGKRWQQDCAAWLRAHGWPSSGYEIRNRSSDLIGTWDLAIECTLTGWDKIWIKLEQSRADARARGLTDYCVWRKRTGAGDAGEGAIVMPAHRFFPLVQRLEKLERVELEAAEAYDRGYRNGQAAALAVERAGFRNEAIKMDALEALETAARMKEGR